MSCGFVETALFEDGIIAALLLVYYVIIIEQSNYNYKIASQTSGLARLPKGTF